jgi:hypothetical protein
VDERAKRIHKLAYIINAKDKRIREILGLPHDLPKEDPRVKFISDTELDEVFRCKQEKDTAEDELIRLMRK